MNKKAVFNIAEVMFYLIVVIIVAVFIALATIKYRNEKIDTTDIETFLLARKLVNTDSCLAYKDSIRTHPGIIDLEKLNTPRLISCFTREGFGYSIKISDLDNKEIKSAENLNDRQKANIKICKNVPKHICTARKEIINYYSEGQIRTGFMEIGVIKLVG